MKQSKHILIVTNKNKRLEGEFLTLLQNLEAQKLCKADNGKFIIPARSLRFERSDKTTQTLCMIIDTANSRGFTDIMFTLNIE